MIKKKLLITLCFFFIVMLVSGCDHSIRTVGVEFVQPPRVVYIANIDTELDFVDATDEEIFNELSGIVDTNCDYSVTEEE